MRVWLDDERPIRDGYDIHVKTAAEAIELLETGKVKKISLDHDLGSEDHDKTGNAVAKWIEAAAYFNKVPRIDINIHSANPVGCKNMRAAVEAANKYWEKWEKESA